LTPSRKSAAILLAALASAAAAAFAVHAQSQFQSQTQSQTQPLPQPQQPRPASTSQPSSPPQSSPGSNLIFLDPAHGASDPGATLDGPDKDDKVPEKDVTLQMAARLRSALAAAGFNVIATRDSDPADPITTDQRAETANRTHPFACIVIHATATGSGVHVYTSTLQPGDSQTVGSQPDGSQAYGSQPYGSQPEDSQPGSPAAFIPTPWDSAQAGFVTRSQALAAAFAAALGSAHLAVLTGVAPLRPLDNLMCPAVAIELAPLLAKGSDPTPVTDAAYQQQVASALASSLRVWHAQPDPAATANASGEDAARRAIASAEAAGRAAVRARQAAASSQKLQIPAPATAQQGAP
jgi:N-acetylmuramoyl-L-alanine amidase